MISVPCIQSVEHKTMLLTAKTTVFRNPQAKFSLANMSLTVYSDKTSSFNTRS